MTQVFTGEGLGLHGSSLGLGSYGPKGVASLGQSGQSAYVNAANGNLVLKQSDGFLAQSGFGLDLFQIYNSLPHQGSSWNFNVQSRLIIQGVANTSGSSITRIDEDGHKTVYVYQETKHAYCVKEGGKESIIWTQEGLSYRDGLHKTAYIYNDTGLLTQIRDKDKHSLQFHYENNLLVSITDTKDKQKIAWTFNNGLLRDCSAYSDGAMVHHIHYEYDSLDRLTQITRDLGNGKHFSIRYSYVSDSNLICDINQSDGVQLHIDYDATGRVQKLIDGEGRVTRFDYSTGKTTVLNALGESWTYYYDKHNHLTGVDGPLKYRIRYHYEGNYLTSIEEGSKIWHFSYNEAGDCIEIEEPTGLITQRMYDADHNLLLERSYSLFDGKNHPGPTLVKRYIYDEMGHIRFGIASDGTVTEYRYDGEGLLATIRTYLQSHYDLKSLNGDETPDISEMQQWVHKQKANTVSLTEYHYDWRGQLIEEIHFSRVGADGVGINTNTSSTHYLYDAAGRLIEKSTPIDGVWSTTYYFYDDLGRLIKTINNRNQTQTYEYDDAHQQIIHTDANGLQTISLYDHSGLLLSRIRLKEASSYGTCSYRYDEAGRLGQETGFDGVTYYYFYDSLGRLQAKVRSNGQLTEYRYNPEGQLVETHIYEQLIATKEWSNNKPSFTEIKPLYSSKDRVSKSVYNQYQQLTYTIDSEGYIVSYEYDARGNLLQSRAYARKLQNYDPNQIYSLNEIHLIPDAQDRKHNYYYDTKGQLIAEINGAGYAKEYEYNRLGKRTKTIQYANKANEALSYNWLEDKPKAFSAKDIMTYSLYDQRGLKIADIDAQGYLTEYQYDGQDLLKKRCTYAQTISMESLAKEELLLDTLRPLESTHDHAISYRYNDLGLLMEEEDSRGLLYSYEYDTAGNILSKKSIDLHHSSTRGKQYRYDALGRVIQSLDEIGCALLSQKNLNPNELDRVWEKHSIRYEYNEKGLLIKQTNALNQSTYFVYAQDNSLRYTIYADGAVYETHFNAYNQLERSVKYSAYLRLNPQKYSCEQIENQLLLLKNEGLDEELEYEYNTLGQLIGSYSPKGAEKHSIYNAFGEVVQISQRITKDRLFVKEWSYDNRGLVLQSIEDKGKLNKVKTYEYNAFGFLEEETGTPEGTKSYRYDKKGQCISIYDARHAQKELHYDAFGRILTETAYGSNQKTIFSYDDAHNTLTVYHEGTNTKISTEFNAFGDKIKYTDARGNQTTYHYDSQGKIVRIDSPEQSSIQYHYNEVGELCFLEESGGRVTAYTYDARSQVLSTIVDPDGLRLKTTYTYDGIGRQLSSTNAGGSEKTFAYDASGNLIEVLIDSKGLKLRTQYQYDDRGLLTKQIQFNTQGHNKITAYEWDNLGRRIAVVLDPEGLAIRTDYAYDASDNIIAQTDARHHTTRYIYDEKNQCRYQINAQGAVTERIYSPNGSVSQIIYYKNRIKALEEYSEEALRNALIVDKDLDRKELYFYDAENRLTLFYNALGYPSSYVYDAAGNLIRKTQYALSVSLREVEEGSNKLPSLQGARVAYYAYDGLNRLCFASESGKGLLEYRYDSLGNTISQTRHNQVLNLGGEETFTVEDFKAHIIPNSEDRTQRYAYDKAGNLVRELSAGGVLTSYEYDSLGQVISSTVYARRLSDAKAFMQLDEASWRTANKDRTKYYVYDAAGRERYRISSEGRVLERCYDALDNIIEERSYSQNMKWQGYDEESLSKALSLFQNALRKTQYTYDAAGRVAHEIDAMNQDTAYEYDATDNVLSKTQGIIRWNYQYDELNRLVETISPQTQIMHGTQIEKRSIITRKIYDSFSNVVCIIEDAEGLCKTTQFEYDGLNRCVQRIYPDVSIDNSGPSASKQRQEKKVSLQEQTQYNAFGDILAQRDKKGNWKHFAYDNQGQLIYTLDARKVLTQQQYNAMGMLVSKTLYAQAIQIEKDCDYSLSYFDSINKNSPKDRTESYIYDLDKQLIETTQDAVRYYNPSTKTYDFAKPVTQYTYNTFGELIKTSRRIHELEYAHSYSYYDQDGHKTESIDAEGYLTRYQYNGFGEIESCQEYAKACIAWDSDSITEPQLSPKDRAVVFQYDHLGRLICKTLKAVPYAELSSDKKSYQTKTSDLSTYYTYDSMGNLNSTRDAQGHISYCYYNELGLLTAKVGPKVQQGLGLTTYTYDSLGNVVEMRQYAKGASLADESHYQTAGASSLDILHRYEYSIEGQVLKDTNAANHSILYSYDANGNLVRSIETATQADNTELVIDKRYRFDEENHLIQSGTYKSDGSLRTEDIRYNAFGEVTDKGVNGLYTLHCEYDSLGRVWRSNLQGYYQIYLYDLADRNTQILSASNVRTAKDVDLSKNIDELSLEFQDLALLFQSNRFDKVGNLLEQIKEFSLQDKAQTLRKAVKTQTYDRWGNLLSSTNPNNHTTYYEYNAQNKLVYQKLPEVEVMDEHGVRLRIEPINQYAYDALGNAIAMKDNQGRIVTKEYDALGRVVLETNASGAQRKKQYNLLDKLANSTNELGGLTTYTYDAANHLVSIQTKYTSQSYSYNELGQLIKQRNGNDRVDTQYWYDSLGNQIKSRNTLGYDTAYEYDDAGHKTKESNALGHKKMWKYDEDGHLIESTDMGGHKNSYQYNKNGLLIEEQGSTGRHLLYEYQADGALSGFYDEKMQEEVHFEYNLDGSLLSKESEKKSSSNQGWQLERETYVYDSQGRLVSLKQTRPNSSNPNQSILEADYDYDALGNIRHTRVKSNYTGTKEISRDDYFVYDENNRMIVNKGKLVNGQISIISNEGSRIAYTDSGEISAANKYVNGYLEEFFYNYNEDNQLVSSIKNGHTISSRIYDTAGRLVQESFFNLNGQLYQKQLMTYERGMLVNQSIVDAANKEINHTAYRYDALGNLSESCIFFATTWKRPTPYTLTHKYSYALWDSYQQETDETIVRINNTPSRAGYGFITRVYDANGQLQDALDQYGTGSIHYWSSALGGVLGRKDQNGETHFLKVNGKNIADVHLDNGKNQSLSVHGGFIPLGEVRKVGTPNNMDDNYPPGDINTFLSKEFSKIADPNLDGLPQEVQGSYTVREGDTLEGIALQIYGDSSLWYVLADANGIMDRNAPLTQGLMIILPPISRDAHHTSGTHKVFGASHFIGNANPTLMAQSLAPSPYVKKHSGLLGKIIVSVIALVVTLMVAGVAGAIAGMKTVATLGSLLSLGTKVLAGSAMSSLLGTAAVGFTAGVSGNLAGQIAAKALGMQEGIDWSGALITGIATAATAGMGFQLAKSAEYMSMLKTLNSLPINNYFNVGTAAEMLEQNAASQTVNVALRKHQYFDWEELAITGISAGLLGSEAGQSINKKLNQLDHNTGLLSSELGALTKASLNTTTGAHFNATDVLKENLGNSVAQALVHSTTEEPTQSPETTPDELYLSDTLYNIAHPERSMEEIALQYYLNQSLNKENRHKFLSINKEFGIEDGYNALRFESDLIVNHNSDGVDDEIRNKLFWESQHGKDKLLNDKKYSPRAMGLSLEKSSTDNLTFSSKEEMWNALNETYGTNIDFRAISVFEGKQRLQGYLPMSRSGKVLGQSGITIATGFDMGQYNTNEIKNYNFPKSLEDKIFPFVGLKRNQAKIALRDNTEIKITIQEANIIDFRIFGKHLKAVVNTWEKLRKSTAIPFNELSSAKQTVLFSRTFHQGPNMPYTKLAKDFYHSAINNKWKDAENYLRKYRVIDAYYMNRVNREADLLKNERR